MLKILIAVMVVTAAGCAGDDGLEPTAPELHDLGDCDTGWQSSVGSCELPCQEVHDANVTSSGTQQCIGRYTDDEGAASSVRCRVDNSFEYRGVLGCCAFDPNKADNGSVYVRFAVCDEQ